MYTRIGSAVLLMSVTALADFSYQQTSRVTGGSMAGMMKMAGAFSAKAREPMTSTVMVRGDRMATVSRDNVHIIDLAKETMTEVNLEKKTYSVLTFAEFSEAMKRLASKMSQGNAEGVQFKADVKQTGQKREISGYSAQGYLVTLTMDAKDKKSGQSGSMDMQMDIWVAPSVAGYDEVKDFYRRMAGKIDWSPTQSMAGPLAAQNGKGMAELAKEMAKLDGLPVLQITRIGTANGAGMPSEADMQAAQAAQEQAPTAKEAATDAAVGSAAGASMGSRAGQIAAGLGGFGGFGRKKKPAPEADKAPPPAASTASAPAKSAGPPSLMEMTTEMSGFSSSVDASKMEVPPGFKQVESDMKKALR